jgi:hypothetical protein
MDLTYEELLVEADELGIKVKEFNLKTRKGHCYGKRIAVHKNLSNYDKACVLAEELGHYHLTVGNITNQRDINNRKQELLARNWSYEKLVSIDKIIQAHEYGCKTSYEMAEYLDVTQEFLEEAVQHYREKYGILIKKDNYAVYFEPRLGILRMFSS